MRTLLAVILSLFAVRASATPYFRLIDPSHPIKIIGVYVDPVDLGSTSVGAPIALVTHSVKDGCFLPSVVCEDWSPLTAGLSYNGGRFKLTVGPIANLTPIAKLGLWSLLSKLTASDTLSGVKSILSSQPTSGPDVSFSFGPALNVAPVDHGVIIPLSEWKGHFVIFTGAAMRFYYVLAIFSMIGGAFVKWLSDKDKAQEKRFDEKLEAASKKAKEDKDVFDLRLAAIKAEHKETAVKLAHMERDYVSRADHAEFRKELMEAVKELSNLIRGSIDKLVDRINTVEQKVAENK